MSPELQDPKWTAYLLDELPETERRAIEQDLAAQPELRSELEALRNTLELTRQALGEPVTGQNAITDHCRQALPLRTRKTPLRFVLPTALAAGLALFLGLNALLPGRQAPVKVLDEAGHELGGFAAEGRIIPQSTEVLELNAEPEPLLLRENTVIEWQARPTVEAAPASPPPAPARARSLHRSFAADEQEVDAFAAPGEPAADVELRAESPAPAATVMESEAPAPPESPEEEEEECDAAGKDKEEKEDDACQTNKAD